MGEANDPWSSVENMLRWQISLARKSVSENQKRLSEVGETYPLPKAKPGASPHGLPDQWGFGNLTNHQVTLSIVVRGLRWAEHEIEKAEAALLEGKLPDSINWIMAANQSINSTLARWHSGSAIAMWRYVGKNRKIQTIKSRSNRATIFLDDEKFSIADLVRVLAAKTDQLGDYIPVKELWGELIGVLDVKGVDPKETSDEKHVFIVDFVSGYRGVKEVRKDYKFTSFKTTVSELRKKVNLAGLP